MVLAGPGSGKTSVIVERIAYLIREGGVAASSILVVTFSKMAAIEMKERFLHAEGLVRSDVTFGTFHGVFFGILKAAYGLGAQNILSGEEKIRILKGILEETGASELQEGDFLEDIISSVSAGSVSASCTWPGEHPNILLSTHAIAMKGALEYLTPASQGSYWSKYIGNCAVYTAELKNGAYTVPIELKMPEEAAL